MSKTAATISFDADGQVLLEQVLSYYHATVQQAPEALDYLKARGIDHPEAIERFKLGYANRTLGLTLPVKQLKAGAEIRGRLAGLGLYRESGHEHFNGSLVIPVMDATGAVVQVYGRKLLDNLRKGTPLHLYLPGPMRGVWNLEALKDSKEIILAKSLIDALTFWCAGYRNVTAAYGVDGFTQDHLDAFQRHGTLRLLIAFDPDEAGDQAAHKVAGLLSGHGIACSRLRFPAGKDANDLAVKAPNAAQALGKVICAAAGVGSSIPETHAPIHAHSHASIHAQFNPDTVAAHHAGDLTVNPYSESSIDLTIEWAGEQQKSSPSGLNELQNTEQSTIYNNISNTPTNTPTSAESSASLGIQVPTQAPTTAPSLPLSLTTPRVAPIPGDDLPHEVQGQDLILSMSARTYRVRGWQKPLNPETLKVNLMVSRDERFHVDSLDLYHAKARTAFIRQAGMELGVSEDALKLDLGKVLRKVEALQSELLAEALKVKDPRPVLTDEEQAEAMALLQSPDLMTRILRDFEALGTVGEESNKLTGYLAAVSRLLDRPLALLIQSASAAGKSSLMDAVLDFMPEEGQIRYSAMSGQSLFYMGDRDLKHRILAIAEEEGVRQASYALKLLQSEGRVTMASTGKHPQTGMLVTHDYTVEGPVMLFLTTTAIDLDEELLNRCLVLTVNESREQTRAIHALQRSRETLEGVLSRNRRDGLIVLHRNAQRLLEPLAVVNPYADQLSFQDYQTRSRRDHVKYLTLIRSIALLHQFQREVRTVPHQGETLRYIEVTPQDIALANELAQEVLGRTMDELLPQTRKLLLLLHEWINGDCSRLGIPQADFRFTRRQVREALGWGDTQLKVHLGRLTELEYLVAHRGKLGRSYAYELLYQGDDAEGRAKVLGLIDCSRLEPRTHATGIGRGMVGGRSGGGRGMVAHLEASTGEHLPKFPGFEFDKAHQGVPETVQSQSGEEVL